MTAAPAMRAFVHVGIPKTGTTTLQRRVFPGHPEINFIGYSVDLEASDHLLMELCFRESARYDADAVKGYARSLVERDPDWREKIVGFSCESFTDMAGIDSSVGIARIQQVFGADTRIVFFLRRQEEALVSYYLQMRDKLAKAGGDPGLERWLESQSQGKISARLDRLDYDAMVAAYEAAFSPERVGVYLFEDLVADPEEVFAGLSEFLGLASPLDADLFRENVENKTRSERLLRFRGMTNALLPPPVYRKAGELIPKQTKRGVRAWLDRGPRHRLRLSDEWRERIAERYGRSNAKLDARRGLGMAHRQYALR